MDLGASLEDVKNHCIIMMDAATRQLNILQNKKNETARSTF